MNENINTPTNNTKQLLIIIIAIIAIVAVVGTANYILFEQDDTNKNSSKYEEQEENQNTSSNQDEDPKEQETPGIEEQPTETTDYQNIEQLTYESFNKMVKDKRSFVILISQTYCSHCIDYKPIYNAAFENRTAKGYELDIVNLTQAQRTEILNNLDTKYTPTTLIFIDGKLQPDRLEGIKTKEELTNFLDMYGFI